jgi:hypothetical protein
LQQRTKMHAEHVLHFLSCKPAENLFCSDDEERTCGEWRASVAHDRNERHMVVVELIKKRFTRRERAPFERERDRITIARARQPVLHDRENATLKPSSNFYHSIPPSCQELEPLSSPVHKVVSFKSPPPKELSQPQSSNADKEPRTFDACPHYPTTTTRHSNGAQISAVLYALVLACLVWRHIGWSWAATPATTTHADDYVAPGAASPCVSFLRFRTGLVRDGKIRRVAYHRVLTASRLDDRTG